jgi:hypothetical protein
MCSAARAATGLLIEAAWNRVCGVMVLEVWVSATPYPFAQAISP